MTDDLESSHSQFIRTHPTSRNATSKSSSRSSASRSNILPELKYSKPLQYLYGTDNNSMEKHVIIKEAGNGSNYGFNAAYWKKMFMDLFACTNVKYFVPSVIVLILALGSFSYYNSNFVHHQDSIQIIDEENGHLNQEMMPDTEYNSKFDIVEILKKEMSDILQKRMQNVEFLTGEIYSLRREMKHVRAELSQIAMKEEERNSNLEDVKKNINNLMHQLSKTERKKDGEQRHLVQIVEAIQEQEQSFRFLKGNIDQLFKNFESRVMGIFQANLDEKTAQIMDSCCSTVEAFSRVEPKEINLEVVKAVKSFLTPSSEFEYLDYAAENQGGSIYNAPIVTVSVFSVKIMGLTLYSKPSVAAEIIRSTPDCWEFNGTSANVTLKLSKKINVTMFSVDYILNRHVSSAPREFSVYGVPDDHQGDEHKFGYYIYDSYKIPMQTFDVQNPSNELFQLIKVSFLSNWGDGNSTCVYRFKVHGNVSTKSE